MYLFKNSRGSGYSATTTHLRTETTERFLRCTLNAEPTRMFPRVRGGRVGSCVWHWHWLWLWLWLHWHSVSVSVCRGRCQTTSWWSTRLCECYNCDGARCCCSSTGSYICIFPPPTRRARTCLEERVVLVLPMVIVRSYIIYLPG